MLSEKLHIILNRFLGKYPDHFDMVFNSDEAKERLDNFVELSSDLKMYESEYVFSSLEEEIQYFKAEKPPFQHLGIYYERVYNLELEKPFGDRKYYSRLLKMMIKDWNLIKDEIIYYRSRHNHRDETLFRKESKDNHIFALIKALEMIEKYLLKANGTNSVEDIIESYPKIKWTGPMAKLSELLIGLKLTNVINDGDMSLEEISRHFGKFVNVEIKDIHGASHDLLARKEPAKYSKEITAKIEQKRDELLEKDYQRRSRK
ncbi:MAG: RteC domain-containing protein [Saprospiraceae bacterium]|nr:RteC domain-containing protein [Saprospiraceae bacterium]